MIINVLVVFVLLALFALIINGLRYLKSVKHPVNPPPAGYCPPAAVIVPVAGCSPLIEQALTSLLNLDYSDYELIFVTECVEDPASAVVGRILKRHGNTSPRCRHIISGESTSCGQKNHNLLAGVAVASPEREMLVFCDCTHLAPVHWLKSLLQPLADKDISVTSGYHRIIPADSRIATLGRTISVLILYCMQLIPRFAQTWGGNMAMRKDTFEVLNVRNVWERNIVDDTSLVALLKKRRVGVTTVVDAELATPLAGECLRGWTHWLTRQWLYIKFCLPGTWIVAGAMMHILACAVLWATACCLATVTGLIPPHEALSFFLLLLLLACISTVLRQCNPQYCPLHRWLGACFITVLVVSWCHLRTCFTREIRWSGKCYQVGKGGMVKDLFKE
jgi:ceramide glucosyltransferase